MIKDGGSNKVGNPLAKDFLPKVEDGTLQAMAGGQAHRVLTLTKMCSYWKNNQDRLFSQMVVHLKKSQLSQSVIRYDMDFLFLEAALILCLLTFAHCKNPFHT